jgi:signal transduction histidine kinase/ligand-binding sensor domain-containing protein/AmiR/NasT family two-component response regulator
LEEEEDGVKLTKIALKNPIYIALFGCIGIARMVLGQTPQSRFEQLNLPEGIVRAIVQDQNGFLWIGSSEGLFRYDGQQFKPIENDYRDTTTISNERVQHLIEDRQGNLWVATPQGLNCLLKKTGKFERFLHRPNDETSLPHAFVTRLFEDSKGRIWVSTWNGFAYFDTVKRRFFRLKSSIAWVIGFQAGIGFLETEDGRIWANGPKGIWLLDPIAQTANLNYLRDATGKTDSVVGLALYQDRRGRIWLCGHDGLRQIDLSSATVKRVVNLPDSLRNKRTQAILEIEKDVFWLQIGSGLLKWLPDKPQASQYFAANAKIVGYLQNSNIQSITEDRAGNIWLGTTTGVEKIATPALRFHFLSAAHTTLGIQSFSRLYQAPDGSFWAANNDYVARADSFGGVFKPFKVRLEKPDLLFLERFFTTAKGDLWLSYSTANTGIYALNRSKNQFERLKLDSKLDQIAIFDVQVDSADPDFLWFSTSKGLCKWHQTTRDTIWYMPPTTGGGRFEQLGDEIFMRQPSSFTRFNKKTGLFKRYTYEPNQPNTISSNGVRFIAKSPDGHLWLALETGLTHFDPKTETFTNYNRKNGLRGGNIVYAILCDKRGRVWFTTYTYLICLDPKTNQFRYFTKTDGIPTTFNRYACEMLADGRFVFGGTEGLVVFHPDSILETNSRPRVGLTEFRVKNQPVFLNYLADSNPVFKVSYTDNTVSFTFSALEFVDPSRNQYAVKLEGFDKDWVYLGHENHVTYTNLAPKTYTLFVKTTNFDGIWNETTPLSIQLIITPLFWQTMWFRALVIILLLAMTYFFYQNEIQNRELKEQQALAEQNARYKSQFLANMSHEIRTPMNAIIGLNQLLLDSSLTDKQREYAKAVGQSAETLLQIINDILDQAKIESGQLSFSHRDFKLADILNQVYHTLRLKAEEKNLRFSIQAPPSVTNLFLNGDPVRLYQILTNLAGNGIKFTKEGSVIIRVSTIEATPAITAINTATATTAMLRFDIEDTGIGIRSEKLSIIFESFRQAEDDFAAEGTGLGLSITKELVERQGGRIEVKSEVSKGTVFTVRLPFELATQTEITSSPKGDSATVSEPILEEKSILAHLRILLVEDTPLNQLLAVELLHKNIENCQVETAQNGQIALDMVKQNRAYDLILMDVKMPIMDGYTATRAIRALPNNTPILGLTANAIPEQIEECRASGMNDVVTKPIDVAELMGKIKIVLANSDKNYKQKNHVNLSNPSNPVY